MSLIEARRSTGSLRGEVRGFGFREEEVVMRVDKIEEGDDILQGLPRYRLKGGWYSREAATEHSVYISKEKLDLRTDVLSDEEYAKFLRGEVSKVSSKSLMSGGLNSGRFRMYGVEVVLLSASEDEAFESTDGGVLPEGVVLVKSSGDKLRMLGAIEPLGGWKVKSLGDSSNLLTSSKKWGTRQKITGSELYLSHAPKDIGEYIGYRLEDDVGLLVKKGYMRVFRTGEEASAYASSVEGADAVAITLAGAEGGLVYSGSNLEGLWLRIEGQIYSYGGTYVSSWQEYKGYGSNKEKHYVEREIRRRGHSLIYKRKSNKKTIGWRTSRRLGYDELLYIEIPITVEVDFKVSLVRSEGLETFSYFGIYGREPSEEEKALHGMYLSLDGLKWESEGDYSYSRCMFSIGGLSNGGVSGRKKVRREWDKVNSRYVRAESDERSDSYFDVTEKLSGLSTTSPYVFGLSLSEEGRLSEDGGFYLGAQELEHLVDYVIEEGSEILGLVQNDEGVTEDKRLVRRLVLLNPKYTEGSVVKTRSGVDSIQLGGSTIVRSIDSFSLDGVLLEESFDYDLVLGNRVNLKEVRGAGTVASIVEKGYGKESVGYGGGLFVVASGASVWFSEAEASRNMSGAYEVRDFKRYEYLSSAWNMKNLVVAEVFKELREEIRDLYKEVEVFSVYADLESVGQEALLSSGYFEQGSIGYKVLEDKVEYFDLGELKKKDEWLSVEESYTDWKWSEDGVNFGEFEEVYLDGREMYRVMKPKEGEWSGLLNEPSLPLQGVEVLVKKRVKTYESVSGAIALEDTDLLGLGERIVVRYYEEGQTEQTEEEVYFITNEEVLCVTEGELEVSKELISTVVSIVNLQNGESYVGVGTVGGTKVTVATAEQDLSYRVSYVVSSSSGGEQVIRVTGKIEEKYLEVLEGSNVLSGNVSSELVSMLVSKGLRVGTTVEIGTHLFTVAGVSLQEGAITFSQVARYPVRVYVSGIEKGSSVGGFRILDADFENTSIYLGDEQMVVLGYKREGNEIEVSNVLGDTSRPKEGDIIKFESNSAGEEMYRVSGVSESIGGGSLFLKIVGKLSKEVGLQIGQRVYKTIRSIPTEGDKVIRPSQVGTIYGLDGYDLLYSNKNNGRFDILKRGEDYQIDTSTSNFVLLGSRKIQAGDQYVLLYSATMVVKSYIAVDGSVVRPKYTFGGVLSERVLNETEASRGLYFKSKKQWSSYYYLKGETDTVIKNKIEGSESLEVYPSVRGITWNQEGEGFGDYDAKDKVARNELFKYHELVLNLNSQMGTYKGDGSVLKEFNYWVEQSGDYYGGFNPETGVYHEQWFMGNQRNLATNEIDDFIRGYKGRWYALLERHDGKLYPTKMNYVVRLETEVEFENGKKIKKKNRGSITNLGFGDINLVSEIDLGHRYGRFKVAGFNRDQGYLFLSAVSLDQFPDLEANGFVADEVFLSAQPSEDIYNRYITSGEIVGSYIPDVKTGRFDLFYAGLVENKSSVVLLKSKEASGSLLYDKEKPAVFGPYPDEETGDLVTVFGYERTVVSEIVDGYAVKFSGTPVLLDGTSLWDAVEIGDTILEVAGGAFASIQGTFLAQGGEIDPAQLLSAGPTYDIGLDIGFSKKVGVYYEKKLSSWRDPGFPWKEILNQRQPKDGRFYEGLVEFNNTEKDPYITPGMEGEYQRTEDGDEGLPLLYRTGEAKVLKDSIGALTKILHSTAENGDGNQERVYPDELRVDPTLVEKPFEIAYTQDSEYGSYIGYIDDLNRGYYNPFDCGSVSAVFELNRMYVVAPLGLTIRQIDTTAVGGTTYKYIFSSIGELLKNEAFDNDNLYIRLVTPFGSKMTISCSSTQIKVQGLDIDSAVDVVSIAVVGTTLEIETAPADGFWFDFIGFNVYFSGSTPFGLEVVANNVGFECEVNYRSDLGIITNNLKQFMCVPLSDSFKPAGLSASGISLIMSDDLEVNGNKGVLVTITDGVSKRSKFNYGTYEVETIDPVMGFVEVVVEQPSGTEWSVLVGSTVDKDGEIFSEASMDYIHKYALLTGAVDKDYSKIKESDIAVLPYGYVAGAYRVKKVVSTEFVGIRRIELAYPEVASITSGGQLTLNYDYNLEEMFVFPNQYVYFCISSSVLYKAKYTGSPSGLTMTIESVTDEAGGALPDFDIQTLVGKKVTGGFVVVYKGALAELPFEDLGGQITQGASNYVAVHNVDKGVYVSLVPILVNALSSQPTTVNVKVRRGIYLDPSFKVLNHYTLSERTAKPAIDTNVIYGGIGGLDLGLGLTINDVSIRRVRRFSDLYSRLSGNFKELYTFYEKHAGISESGLTFLANRYVLLAKSVLTELEAEYLSYIPEYTAPNLYSFTFDRERPKVKVSDIVWLGENREYMLKVVNLLDDQKTVYGLIYNVDAPAINTQLPKPNNDITYEQLAEYDEPIGGFLPADPTYYEIEYRNPIGEFPLEQTFETLMKNAFIEVYAGANGNGVLADDLVYHTGVSLEELIATYKLTDAKGVVTTDSTLALADLVNNCYLVVDGAGLLPTGEYGRPPEGDYWDSTLQVIIQQLPTGIDDNRGVYSITGLNATTGLMAVQPVVTLEEYLPAVLGVTGVDAHQLQVSIAPNPLYGDNPRGFSIQNYGFKILKRKDHIGKDLAEWILFSRERTYSWFEKLTRFETMDVSTWALFEGGQYQQVGVNDTISLSDVVLESYEGNIAYDGFVAPLDYKPTIDKLSIHERRMWVGDSKGLDGEGYSGYPEANAFVETEDLVGNYRDIRNNWVELRGGLENGSYMRVRGYNW